MPDRVPTHWRSSGSSPDGWSSRPVGLAVPTLLALLLAAPRPWLSRLVLLWPDGVNLRDRRWWTQPPGRLVRLKRLLRDDLILAAASLLALLAGPVVVTGVAAHRPGGEVRAWEVLAPVGCPLATFVAALLRMGLGRGYRATISSGPGPDRAARSTPAPR